MKLLLQPDVLETLGMCAVWFVAGVLTGCQLRKFRKDGSEQWR